MGITAQQEFISIGVNRVVSALDWGHDDLVAYGGHHSVVIYSPKVTLEQGMAAAAPAPPAGVAR